MTKRKVDTASLPIKVPKQVLYPRDFNMPSYDCMFINQQKDGSLVGLYRSKDIDNYHWIVVRGCETEYFASLTEARVFCKRKGYVV